jgi:hypothetical protein
MTDFEPLGLGCISETAVKKYCKSLVEAEREVLRFCGKGVLQRLTHLSPGAWIETCRDLS